MRLPLTLALALALPAASAAKDVPEGSVIHYACAGGGRLAAAYINASGGASYAVVIWEGRMTPMKAGPSGSGVRYVSLDASNIVWHTKGDAGFLARDDAAAIMIAEGCNAAR